MIVDGHLVDGTTNGICGPAPDAVVNLEVGNHMYDVVYANDGGHRDVGLLYSGPDTGGSFVRFASGNMVANPECDYPVYEPPSRYHTPSPYYAPSPYYTPSPH